MAMQTEKMHCPFGLLSLADDSLRDGIKLGQAQRQHKARRCNSARATAVLGNTHILLYA